MGAALVIGCGGGGSGVAGTSSGTTSGTTSGGGGSFLSSQSTFNGKVTFPTGFAVDSRANTYSVLTSLGEYPIGRDGSFSAKGYTNGQQIAFVVDQTNRIYMMGRIAAGETDLSAESTAVALGYAGASGALVPAQNEKELMTTLKGHSSVAAMKTKIETALISGKALDDYRGDLATDLQNLQSSFQTRGMLVNPSNGKSGITLDTSVTGQVSVINSFRRRVYGWIDRVGYRADEQSSVTDITPVQVGDALTFPGTDSYAGVIGTLGNAFAGSYAFSAKTYGPYDLPLNPTDSYSTVYKLTTAGFGTTKGDYDSLTPARQKEVIALGVRTVIVDVAIPMYYAYVAGKDLAKVDTADGQLGLLTDQASLKGAVKNLVDTVISNVPNIPDAVASGDVKGATALLMNAVANDANVQTAMLQTIDTMLLQQGGSALANKYSGALMSAMKIVKVVDLGGGVLDLLVQGWGYGHSTLADVYTIEVTKGKAKLTADKKVATWTDMVNLKTTTPDIAAGTPLEYHYTLTGGGTLYSNHGSGKDITVTDDAVIFSQTGTKAVGKVTVTVQVRKIDGTSRVPVGSDSVTLDIVDAGPVLSPEITSLLKGESETFDVKIKPQTTLAKTAYYRYSVSDKGLGTLDVDNAFTTSTHVTYKAGNTLGTDTLKVEMYTKADDGEWVKWGESNASILIEAKKSIIDATYESSIGLWSDEYGTGSNVEADVRFKKQEGATHYEIIGTGGWDYAYYGYRINISGVPSYFQSGKTSYSGVDVPAGELWQGLSGVSGHGDPAISVAGMDARFKAFRWKVKVTF